MTLKTQFIALHKWPRGFTLVCRLCLLVTLIFVMYMSVKPQANMPQINHVDKIYHILAYMTLGVLALFSAFSRRVYWPVLIVIGFGVGVEVLQGVAAIGRTSSFADVLANSIGAALALMVYVIVVKPKPIEGKV